MRLNDFLIEVLDEASKPDGFELGGWTLRVKQAREAQSVEGVEASPEPIEVAPGLRRVSEDRFEVDVDPGAVPLKLATTESEPSEGKSPSKSDLGPGQRRVSQKTARATAPTKRERKLTDERILEVLKEAGPQGASLDLLSRWFALSYHQVILELESLVEAGRVTQTDSGGFKIT